MKFMRKVYSKQKGFTLIELMAVVGIMGILAGVLIPQLTGVQNRARDTGIMTAAGSIRTAMSIYYTESNQYPVYGEDINGTNTWDDLQSELSTVALDASEEYNIEEVIYQDNSDHSDKYLIEFISASDEQVKYYLGEKTFSEKKEEASDL